MGEEKKRKAKEEAADKGKAGQKGSAREQRVDDPFIEKDMDAAMEHPSFVRLPRPLARVVTHPELEKPFDFHLTKPEAIALRPHYPFVTDHVEVRDKTNDAYLWRSDKEEGDRDYRLHFPDMFTAHRSLSMAMLKSSGRMADLHARFEAGKEHPPHASRKQVYQHAVLHHLGNLVAMRLFEAGSKV